MKRNSNFFKQGLEVEEIKKHIAKSIVEDTQNSAKNISTQLPKKVYKNIEKEKE